MTDKPARKRRWFRFSLRTLLIVVMLLSLPLGWLAMKMIQAERQRRAVEAIQEAGGEVFYDWEVDYSGMCMVIEEWPASAWLALPLGEK